MVLLLACNVLVPLTLVVRRSVLARGVEVDHLLLFTFGFLVYWISPFALGLARPFEGMPGMSLWYAAFDQLPMSRITAFLALTFAYYLTFWSGSMVAQRLFARAARKRKVLYFHRKLLNFYLIPGVLVSLVLAVSLREYLFRGYRGIDYEEVTLRGSLVSSALFLLVLAILYANHLDRKANITFRQVITNRFFAAFFAVAMLLLLMGGRLYFFTSVFMLLVYRSVFFGAIKFRSFLFFLLIAAALAGSVGIVRMGASVSSLALAANLAAEPLFTSFSLIEFLRVHDFELLRAPIFLLSGFANLLPYILFPWKQQLILDPSDYGYMIYSPLGALNSFVSFMINFGVLGTGGVLFLFSGFLGYLRVTRESTFSKVLYIMISGWLAFSFFRDPFSISIVKSMFQFSVLIPILVIVSLHVISSVARVGSGQQSSVGPFSIVAENRATKSVLYRKRIGSANAGS